MTAALRLAFDPSNVEAACALWRQLIHLFEGSHPTLAELLGEAEHNGLAYKTFPRERWS